MLVQCCQKPHVVTSSQCKNWWELALGIFLHVRQSISADSEDVRWLERYVWQILSSLVGLTICCSVAQKLNKIWTVCHVCSVLFDSTIKHPSCQCFLSLKCMHRLKATYKCTRSLVYFHHILYDQMDTPVSGPVWASRNFDLVIVKFLWKLSYCYTSFISTMAFLSFLITIIYAFFFFFKQSVSLFFSI